MAPVAVPLETAESQADHTAVRGAYDVATRERSPAATSSSAGVTTSVPPRRSTSPSFLNRAMNLFTRDRVVPTISAMIDCDTSGRAEEHGPRSPQPASASRQRATLLAQSEELVDQVGLDGGVAGQEVRNKAIVDAMLRAEQSNHLPLLYHQHPHRCQGGRRLATASKSAEGLLPEKRPRPEEADNRLLAAPPNHRQPDASVLDVEHAVA